MSQAAVEKLQKWYAGHCNGDWEHRLGVRIETLDNPGWMLTVDLAETELDGKPFQETVVEVDESNWYRCRIVDRVFRGAGGARNLIDLIEAFVRWAE